MFYETFEDLFENHSYVINDAELKAYSKNWHKPAAAKDLARYDQVDPDYFTYLVIDEFHHAVTDWINEKQENCIRLKG